MCKFNSASGILLLETDKVRILNCSENCGQLTNSGALVDHIDSHFHQSG